MAAPPLSQIEKSVTHLLVATKQLLETLTQWSRNLATDAQVSDVYVRLGYEFNIACRAFTAINVDTSDLGNVPELLRAILESTLSQEASVESLERYLPKIRDIIINLLHGLKRKQQKLRQKTSRDSSNSNGDNSLPRNSSVSSIASRDTALTTLLDQGMSPNYRYSNERDVSVGTDVAPPRTSSASSRRAPPPVREQSRVSVASADSADSLLSSNTLQNMPVLPPYPDNENPLPPRPASEERLVSSFPLPAAKPPKNALTELQRGGELERRASKRYSAYQISKLIGASPGGVPMMPPVQHSPIPNRGRNDARESMRAVQNRVESRHQRQQSTRVITDLSSNPNRISSRISEEGSNIDIPPPVELPADDSPMSKTPEDKLRQPAFDFDGPSATLKAPITDDMLMIPHENQDDYEPGNVDLPEARDNQEVSAVQQSPAYSSQRTLTPEPAPSLNKELTIFLQYKTKVKKFVLTDGYDGLSMARLQLAFIEKFAWNTHNNGVDLPEIYIQDSVSGVRHELEDLSDIKDRSVLVLNIEVLDEVKRHIDEGLMGVMKMVEGVKTAVDDQQVTIQRVSERQQDTAKEMARLASAPPASSGTPRSNGVSVSKVASDSQNNELRNLRRDMAVLRQTYSGFESGIQDSMSQLRTLASSVKDTASKAVVHDLKGDSGRSYILLGQKTLSVDSDKLVTQVDDLQDIIEDLRKDVVMRGVRPLPRQLETVAKDIAQATIELKKMQDYMTREKPNWTRIWEKELETVCKDREELTLNEDIAADLQDDLEKASQTFALVEQATKEQMKDLPGNGPTRTPLRSLNHVVADPSLAKEGVLGEVRALQPNHENRLEAIERAEKLRRKELESRRGGEFQKELGKFVEEGKLKKAGGFEEVERARKLKDERNRREVWERQNGMTQADADGAEDEEEEAEEEEEGEAEEQEPDESFGDESIADEEPVAAEEKPDAV